VILVDTSGLLAALGADQSQHEAAAKALLKAEGPRVLSPFVLAELDYLVSRARGVRGELQLLAEVSKGAYDLVPFDANDVEQASQVVARYHDLGIGLADASLVVLSRRFGCLDVLTLDERHFRVLRGAGDASFRLLPTDA
jgi:predicted nucleic acid-binding protein